MNARRGGRFTGVRSQLRVCPLTHNSLASSAALGIDKALRRRHCLRMDCQRTDPDPPLPEHCASMEQVRAGVDRVDRELIRLLQRRFGYMKAAARIKSERTAVRDEARKAQVHTNVLQAAKEAGVPAPVVSALWEQLIEASIAYELAEWDRLRS